MGSVTTIENYCMQVIQNLKKEMRLTSSEVKALVTSESVFLSLLANPPPKKCQIQAGAELC